MLPLTRPENTKGATGGPRLFFLLSISSLLNWLGESGHEWRLYICSDFMELGEMASFLPIDKNWGEARFRGDYGKVQILRVAQDDIPVLNDESATEE